MRHQDEALPKRMLIDGKLTDGAALAGEIMQKDDLILISVDDHIIEPPDMFVNHLPAQVPGRRARGWCTATTAPTSGSSGTR